MHNNFSITAENIDETFQLANKFANMIKKHGAFVCLYGDIGAGKTEFSRMVAKSLNVTEKVTSPSFVIINEYLSGEIPVYHFDLYRLEAEGVKTIAEELNEYSKSGMLTLVEWAEFSDVELPCDRIEIRIEYMSETSRKFSFSGTGNCARILEGLKR
jgi:tRNA threonylcarbamoyladenosine biosynthesis protein TsaE